MHCPRCQSTNISTNAGGSARHTRQCRRAHRRPNTPTCSRRGCGRLDRQTMMYETAVPACYNDHASKSAPQTRTHGTALHDPPRLGRSALNERNAR